MSYDTALSANTFVLQQIAAAGAIAILGTPILAFKAGAVPEIVVDGKTGFVVDCLTDMIGAVDRLDRIDPGECRKHVQDHFSITRMAKQYSELYQQIVGDYRHKAAAVGY